VIVKPTRPEADGFLIERFRPVVLSQPIEPTGKGEGFLLLDAVVEGTNRARQTRADDTSKGDGLPRAALDRLNSLGAFVAVPTSQGSQLVGPLLLGQKRSGDFLSRRDLAFLNLVSGPTLSAIQKAKLYEGDQTKTEFVSIAAHELLTPITGIQRYISMILDEGFGKVDPQAKGYLSKAYRSTKRLSELVKDLLSVSRIEAGRMEFKPRQLDLQAVIRDAVDQVAPNATAKGLTLTFEPPADL